MGLAIVALLATQLIWPSSTSIPAVPSWASCRASKPTWGPAAVRYVTTTNELARRQPNYTGGVACGSRDELHLSGVGDPAPELAARMAQAPSTVHVVWHSVPHTWHQIMVAGTQACTGADRLRYIVGYGADGAIVPTGLEIGIDKHARVTLAEAKAQIESRISNGVTVVHMYRTVFPVAF